MKPLTIVATVATALLLSGCSNVLFGGVRWQEPQALSPLPDATPRTPPQTKTRKPLPAAEEPAPLVGKFDPTNIWVPQPQPPCYGGACPAPKP